MRPSDPLRELSLKVPGPFAGVDALGFTARYPEQGVFAPMRDVPLWIEGPAAPVRSLNARLRMLAAAAPGPYAWTDPVQLADEVLLISFRDRSTGPGLGEVNGLDYLLNLVRPVVFPFLRDCAVVAHLRLADRIDISVETGDDRHVARLVLRASQIAEVNGEDWLAA